MTPWTTAAPAVWRAPPAGRRKPGSTATPTPTPTRLAVMAGPISDQFTCGLARASVTAAFTSDSTLTTFATSDTDANWNTPDNPSRTSPNAKPVMVWA
ncbi:hypothetical protein G6F65_021855 [Rhizopus arrhizus]|nr:hypothetical protein G6F65_021855 [Rhizopus arrhizus]